MEFANKEYLFLLLLIIPYLIWYVMFRKKSEPTLRMSDTFAFNYAPKSWRVKLMPLQLLLRIVTFTLIVIVLARPQTSNSWKNKSVEGIDIMLAIDVSTVCWLKTSSLTASRQPRLWPRSLSSVAPTIISVCRYSPERHSPNAR